MSNGFLVLEDECKESIAMEWISAHTAVFRTVAI